MKTVAIVLAAGQGKRMNSDVAKQYLNLQGKPILFYALDVFEKSFIDEVVLVVGADEVSYCKKEIVEKYNFQKVTKIVAGGKERYHSVVAGLGEILETDYIFIHDGARPFINQEILLRGLEQVKENQACVIGMPTKDTIKIADEDGWIDGTPNRSLIWMIQTPQIFSYSLIKEAYGKLMEEENNLQNQGIQITDDAMVVELLTNHKVKLVEGSYSNIKITTPEDLKIAEVFLQNL
ncbi:MAG: 2-C-methyl-D-erythritol 4-phosphate cytidylyltransferase [Eubacteriales bacterium]